MQVILNWNYGVMTKIVPTQGGCVLYSAAEDRHGVGSRIVAHHQWSTLSVSNIAL